LPELNKLMGGDLSVLGQMLNSRDSAGRMGIDRENLQAAMMQLNQGYGQAGNVSRETIGYNALRGGLDRTDSLAVDSAIRRAATGLERDQVAAQRNLEFMSARASQENYNKVLQLLGQGANSALGLAGGFAGASNAAIGGLSGSSQFGSTLGGAASGASMGATFGPYGALAGGIIGGAAGYFGNGG
jgi:hypothetical protein